MTGKRIPSLDGLRGISILIVILGHASHTAHFPLRGWLVDRGAFGVQIFFVISGYLITTLLLNERITAGSISLRKFYVRRALRIFPAAYAFLGIVAALAHFGWVPLRHGDILAGAAYVMNYRSSAWTVGHLWSLSVEEQFYLCWPLIMSALAISSAFRVALAVAGGAPLVVGVLLWFHAPIGAFLMHVFPFVADAIAAGCVLAIALRKWGTNLKRIAQHRLGCLAPAFAVTLVWTLYGHPRAFIPMELGTDLAIAYCIARWSFFSEGPRILNAGWLPRLGVLSYSLYLWQQPFLSGQHSGATAFPQNIGLALAAAAASYCLLERPLMGLRARLK